MPPGSGTLLNVVAVLVGSGLGLLLGDRLPARTRDVVTDALGLVTLLAAALSASAVLDGDLERAVGSPLLVVLGSLLLGGIAGSLLRVEERLAGLGALLQARVARRRGGPPDAVADGDPDGARDRFVRGFLTASLVFCVGPLTVLGSIEDGLGRGIEQLALKSTLDGFASLAFASALGVGVAASALSVLVVQGGFTLVGVLLGDVLSGAQVAALTATGGLLLVGIGVRLLRLREVPVGDLLPALVVAPLLVPLVDAVL